MCKVCGSMKTSVFEGVGGKETGEIMCNTEDCLHYDYVRLAWDIGFVFEDYDRKHAFDFSVIGLVDVEKVAKDRDIPTVVKHIPTLLNFRLDNEIGKVLEPNFVKLFRLSQLAIQYLIFCKKYLDSTVALIKSELIAMHDEKTELETYLEELKSENVRITRKYEELKATQSTSIFKCEECSKTFYSEEYLLAHIRRRHQVHNVQMQTEADKLQLEIKELKQRLNNTERFFLKDEMKSEDALSPKENAGDKEKELESVEPNNDAALEDTIQFKFEQLKNHIETEINHLKDEDFYKGICERYIKERVEKNLSSHTIQNTIDLEASKGEQRELSNADLQNSQRSQQSAQSQATAATPKESFVDLTSVIDDAAGATDKSTNEKGVEISTQTDHDLKTAVAPIMAVSEGTSMSPQPTPRKLTKPHDDGDHESIGAQASDRIISEAGIPVKEPSSRRASIGGASTISQDRESNQGVMKTIEEKLAKEVELQRETLEHILDLKLSGSLNKMEAQMTAFWQKLNAWESNLSYAKSNSVPSVNIQSEPVKNVRDKENGDVVMRRQNSVGSLPSGSPLHKMAAGTHVHHVHQVQPRQQTQGVPKALPRTLHTQKAEINRSSVTVVPKTSELRRFLDSSDEETEDSKSEESKSSQSISEETPSNMKPTDSFKKRLDATLQQRLKTQMKVQTVAEVHDQSPVLHRVSEKPTVSSANSKSLSKPTHDTAAAATTEVRKTQRKLVQKPEVNTSASDEHDESNESDYKNMKKRLKRHVEESVNQKLKDIGVSPHWKCLPEKSYAKAMEIVEHQATLSKKNVNDFHKIRKNIERSIDKEIEKTNDGRKRRATVNLPISARPAPKRQGSVEATPTESSPPPTESSVEIPLQRVTGRSTIKPNSRRSSLQSDSVNSSPLKTPSPSHHHHHHHLPQMVKTKAEVEASTTSKQTKPETEVASSTIVTNISNNGNKTSGAEKPPPAAAVPQSTKKKVLFNLESDTEQSELQSPTKPAKLQNPQNKTDLASFVNHEKSKLDKHGKHTKPAHLELHTGSESSDWDISDVT